MVATADYNALYSTGPFVVVWRDDSQDERHETLEQYRAASGQGTHSVDADPAFVTAAAATRSTAGDASITSPTLVVIARVRSRRRVTGSRGGPALPGSAQEKASTASTIARKAWAASLASATI